MNEAVGSQGDSVEHVADRCRVHEQRKPEPLRLFPNRFKDFRAQRYVRCDTAIKRSLDSVNARLC